MVEVMTDKATVTITSPRAGRIVATSGAIGEVVAVHAVLVVFELDAAADAGPAPPPATPKLDEGPAATAVGDIKESLPGMSRPSASAGASAPSGASAAYFSDKPLATPATRKLARDKSVDLRLIPPTGPQGRVTKSDVELFLQSGSAGKSNGAHAPSTSTHGEGSVAAAAPRHEPVRIASPVGTSAALEERVPFAGMRRRISQKMSQSKHTAAHFTFVEECDVSRLKELRARLKPQAEARGVRLTFLPFIVKATVAALKKHPILNSALDESTNELVYRKYFNIGIAASTDAGLMVPVVKDADRLSLLGIAKEIERLAADAKAGKSRPEDMGGSTFTITSLGMQGGLFATPIINFPEVGILGVHRIKEKPVVRDGQIVIGEEMLLSLSFDHRIVDGHVGAAFAYDIIGYLQDPDTLLLDL
jgi:pyruvate dehydrogenase E2 component (dihydrolipoamide acetyltransferase)